MAYDANFSESATFNATFAGNAIDAVSNEVIDIRTAYDGTVYPSAGDAVRGQIEEAMESSGSSVPTNVRQAMLTLFESAAYAETGLTDEIAVVQSWASEVTEISLSASTLSLNGSTPQTLVATTVPTGSAVVWTTSDSTIATVVGGVVTGISNGSCTITASAGDKSATCAVTVTGFAVLESISAVYTQSGTVYDTYLLDTLKPDLVVTANYSDSTTETVSTYTLSGTLEAGTSTITVAYNGKVTTFTVTVSSRIPTAYKQIEYLQSDGTQAIETDIAPRDTMTEATFEFVDFRANKGNFITGSISTGDQRYYAIWIATSGQFTFSDRFNTHLWDGPSNPTGKHTAIYNNSSHQALYDGEIKATSANFVLTSGDNTLCIFTRKVTSTGDYLDNISIAKIYSVKYTDNATGNVIGEFIPCYRKSDGVGGMYDIVTDTFYTDILNGDPFVLGADAWEEVI